MSTTASTPSARIALVTGASQGIGLDIALRLADDGLDIAVNDLPSKRDAILDVVAKIQARGRRAIAVPADVSSEEQVKEMIAAVADQLGGLDVMVANAGIAWVKSLFDTTIEDWDNMMAIDARSVMLCYKYAALQMIKQGRGGRMLAACSTASKRGGPNLTAYCAAKFAVRGLTLATAMELAPHNITVNGYAPGFIITPLTLNPNDTLNGGKPGSIMKQSLGLPPPAPEATPEVISSMVSYLVKPESYFINGQIFLVDGGLVMD